jgi:hypothetical protein
LQVVRLCIEPIWFAVVCNGTQQLAIRQKKVETVKKEALFEIILTLLMQ